METNLPPTNHESRFNECKAAFDAIFKLTTAASKIIDSDLKILKVNRALTELLGYSDKELIGTRIMDHACEEDKQHWHELQDAMWQQGKPNFQLDACLKKKDGSLVWVHVTTIVFKEDDIPYAYTILDDFTDWKKLQESEQRLSMALKYSSLAVWELDLADRSISRSDGFDRLFGESETQKEWDEESFVAMFLPEDQQKLKEMLAAVSPGHQLDFQGCVRTRTGTIKWINLQGRAERKPDGKIRVLGTLFDITRDKLAEREKDDFISIASHELKTPLTALKGSLQLLEKMKDAPTPKMPALLEQASKGADRVSVLVDDLLNATRMNEGQLHLRKTRFNLSTAIAECCLHITAGGKNDILTDGVQDIEVEADAERIQRVIFNLVNNAVRYAPGSKDIIIRVDSKPGQVKVSVTDKGPGIAKDNLPHLFDRFYRANEYGEQYSGLGLGLYISAEIIKKHGGQIGVDSIPGQGSTFWFSLPA